MYCTRNREERYKIKENNGALVDWLEYMPVTHGVQVRVTLRTA